MRVLDLTTGESTGEVLEWVKFSGASWVNDGFYTAATPRRKAVRSVRKTPSTACTSTKSARRRTRTSWSSATTTSPTATTLLGHGRRTVRRAQHQHRTDGNALHVMDREADSPAGCPWWKASSTTRPWWSTWKASCTSDGHWGARYRLVAAAPPRHRPVPVAGRAPRVGRLVGVGECGGRPALGHVLAQRVHRGALRP